MTDIAERREIGVPARVPRSFVPDSLVHPAAGPTRAASGPASRATSSAVPELFADRALSVTRSFQETEGRAARHPPGEDDRAHPAPTTRSSSRTARSSSAPRRASREDRRCSPRSTAPGWSATWTGWRRASNTPFFVDDDDQARAARRGLPVLARPAGRRPPDGSRAAGRCGAPTTAASSTTTSARARSGTSTPATRRSSARGSTGSRRMRRAVLATVSGRRSRRRRRAAVPRVGHAGVRRGRSPSPAVTRRRFGALAAARAGRRAPRRAAEDGRGVRPCARRARPHVPRGAAVDVVHAPRAEPRDRRPRLRPGPLRPVPLPVLPPLHRLGRADRRTRRRNCST